MWQGYTSKCHFTVSLVYVFNSRPWSHHAEDHKPAAAAERARIISAGGFLSEIGGITRVNGNLNLSRAIGDLRYKMNADVRTAGRTAPGAFRWLLRRL
jgi:serine/threonine protein phosphatase PrpC